MRLSHLNLLAVLVTLALGTTAHAQTQYTWQHNGTDWTAAGAWDPSNPDWTATGLTDSFAIFASQSTTTNQPDISTNTLYTNGLSFDNSGTAWTLNGSTGSLTIGSGGILVTGGKTTTINANLGLAVDQTWYVDSVSTLTHNGLLSGSTGLSITGGGTVKLAGDLSSYTGTFSVQPGAKLQIGSSTTAGLFLGSGGASPSEVVFAPTANTSITFSGPIEGEGILTFGGTGTTVFIATLTENLFSPTAVNVLSGATLQIGDDTNPGPINSNITNDGTVIFKQPEDFLPQQDFNGVISGAGGLIKDGNNLLSFASIQTYTGPTIIKAGTLQLIGDGSIGSSSTITVFSGATFDVSEHGLTLGASIPQILQGGGTVNGNVTVSGGSTIRGGTPGEIDTLSVSGNLNLGTDSPILRVEVSRGQNPNTATASTINVGGALNLKTGFNIDVENTANNLVIGETYTITLAQATGGFTLNDNPLPDGQIATTDYTVTDPANINFSNVSLDVVGSDLKLTFTVIPVPEPAAVLGVAFGALAIGGLVRRRLRNPAEIVTKA